MTERGALLAAGSLHLALFLALSLGLARALPPMDTAPDVTPVDFIDVGAEAIVTTPPRPSMEAAPRDPGMPPPDSVQDSPLDSVTPAPPAPDATPDDTAPQDAIAEQAAKAPPPKKAVATPKDNFDLGAMASLIDKALPKAPAKPKDTSAFAKSIEQAIPKGVRVGPRQIATLEQAIRSQIAPCWNPPIGGADVQGMTAVLKIRLNRDGSVAAQPEFVSQTGATAGNQAYSRAFVETARRAVLRCAPLQLPDDMFAYWREFELNFDPRLMT